MEKTLVLLKPCTLQRGLVGEVINRFEKRGLRLAGMKMMQLTDAILDEHYVHTSDSLENAKIELARFFKPEEIFEYESSNLGYLYALDEL